MKNKKLKIFLKKYWIEICLLIITPIIASSYGITEFPVLKDMGFFSYLGQEILRGYPVYSTAFELKPPLIPFFFAFSMSVFNFLPQYLSIRLFMLIVITIMILLFYEVLLKIFNDKLISVLSALILISFSFFVEMFLLGDSKGVAIFFGLLTFFLIYKRYYLLSGISASLCFLFYQITFLFLLSPLFFIFLERRKHCIEIKKYGKIFLGFFVPLILLVFYFFFYGSVRDLIDYSIIYPLKYEAEINWNLWTVLNVLGYYCSEFFFLLIGSICFLYFSFKCTYKMIKNHSLGIIYKNKYLTVFILPFLLYMLFIPKFFEGGTHLIVLLPFISVLTAFILIKIRDYLTKIIPNKILTILLIAIVCVYGFLPALQPVYPENPILRERNNFSSSNSPFELISQIQKKYGVLNSLLLFLFHRPGEEITIKHQLELAGIIKNNTNENEKILSLSSPEILFLSQRRNMNKYPLFNTHEFQEIAEKKGELDGIKGEIIKYKPKFILTDKGNFLEKFGLNEFVNKNYKEMDLETPLKNDYKVYTTINRGMNK